jgi:polyketide synthase 12
LVIPPSGSVAVQVMVGAADESGARALSVFSRSDARPGWTLHAEGQLSSGRRDNAEPATDLSTWPPVGAVPVAVDGLYGRLAARGYGYGPAFQGH